MGNQKGEMFPPQDPFFKAIYNPLINKFFYIAMKKRVKTLKSDYLLLKTTG
jgi:hypothetical protein